jgi:hypothetical protein
MYGYFYHLPQLELYITARKSERRPLEHFLRFKFSGNRLALSLTDKPLGHTHFFLSPGLLLKYFNHKKSLKKNKSMRLLMMRFLRKLLIVIKLKSAHVHVKGIPLFLDTLLNMLFQPLTHPVKDPFTDAIIDETLDVQRNIKVTGITFIHPKPYGFHKQKKKGRVKRKIRRRVMKANRVIDEK